MTAAPHIDPDDLIGRRFGSRTVIAVVRRWTRGEPRTVRVMCDCGTASCIDVRQIESGTRCRLCVRREQAKAAREVERARWEALVGTTIGTRTVIAYEGVDHNYRHRLRLACACGREAVIPAAQAHRTTGCKACMSGRKAGAVTIERDAIRTERTRRYDALLAERARACPEVWRIECTDCSGGERCHRCAVQVEAVAELSALLGPMTLEEIGALRGVSRERARQIESAGLRALRDHADVRELAADLPDRDDDWMTRGAEA